MKSLKKISLWLLAIVFSMSTSIESNAQSSNNSDYKIYFTLREKPEQNARIVSYDGKELKKFTPEGKSSRGENSPSVSPNGKWITFNTYHFGGWKTAIANIDGTNIRQVSKSGNYSGVPSFSKDNKWIIFYEHENGRMGMRNVFKIKVDGTGKKQLTQNSKHHYFPSFSPDGSKISFLSSRDGGNYEVFVMDSDGSNITNITKHGNHESSPSWSPDGKRIAFLSIRNGFLNLYTINPDGTNLKNLTKNEEKNFNSFPQTADSVDELSYLYGTSWSPDGKSIVFVQKKEDNLKLFTINADGTNLRELVSSSGNQYKPFWAK
ncbi:MAG: DPP IV N-terminal domain-containing protein [Psychroserpens sp.]|uniref:DPP IV N-terminal domain-containing protein n=1 Tax=Psychroserpens sp. TaxID=2020870 RepID=UPI003002A5DE